MWNDDWIVRLWQGIIAALALLALWLAPAAGAKPSYPIVVTPSAPVGTVLLVHAGGWAGPSPKRVEEMRPAAKRFASLRWRAVVVEYSEGKGGYFDLRRAVRHWTARRGPLVLYGESAGAHLSTLAATRPPARRRGVEGVIGVAGPLDFDSWDTNPVAAYHRDVIARHYFGDDPRWDPATFAARLRVPMLAISTANDQVVPPQQARAFGRQSTRHFRRITLAEGDQPSGHGSSTEEDLARADRAQRRLLRAVVRRAPRRG